MRGGGGDVVLNHLSLFSGYGGIDIATHLVGIKTVAFCEREPACQDVLRKRWPGVPIINDIRNVTREGLTKLGIGAIDIISGGFPCQPFSHAGRREGTADDRYLWPEMRRVIEECRPTWVIGENVRGLVSMAQSDWQLELDEEGFTEEEAETVLESIRQDFENMGYRSLPILIPACAVGATHERYRIFIVGTLADTND
jgi:DNA (cytosine-5)-methyltransferase 1